MQLFVEQNDWILNNVHIAFHDWLRKVHKVRLFHIVMEFWDIRNVVTFDMLGNSCCCCIVNATILIFAAHCVQEIARRKSNVVSKMRNKFAAALQCMAQSNTFFLLGFDGDVETVRYWLNLGTGRKKGGQDWHFKNEYARSLTVFLDETSKEHFKHSSAPEGIGDGGTQFMSAENCSKRGDPGEELLQPLTNQRENCCVALFVMLQYLNMCNVATLYIVQQLRCCNICSVVTWQDTKQAIRARGIQTVRAVRQRATPTNGRVIRLKTLLMTEKHLCQMLYTYALLNGWKHHRDGTYFVM